MDALRITGGRPLAGTVDVSGSKNAALPIMAAALLTSGAVALAGVPQLLDVHTLSRVLTGLGMWVRRDAGGLLRLDEVDPTRLAADASLVRRMRASFCVLGPLLARRGRAVVPLPGGCAIGERPIDLHLHGLAALGADIRIRERHVVATARRLTGAMIHLAGPCGPTVTGTANVLMAATLARGTTVLTGAATEPEVVDLGRFLVALGARIDGLGTSTIEIHGVEQLGGAAYRVIPDRIEAATLLVAGAISGGAVTLRGAAPEHLTAVLETLDAMGATVAAGDDSIALRAARVRRAVDIVARPYPCVPTDVQSQLTALATLSPGVSRIADRVFPGRFHHVKELARLGADIRRTSHGVVVSGVTRLSGARLTATDLRASAALVLAGLAAEGTTLVRHIAHLDRGYQRLEDKLNLLGAAIGRVSLPQRARQRSTASMANG